MMNRFFLLLSLMFVAPAAIADDHVVILLDTSGSMSERMRTESFTKMNAAHKAIQKVIDQMPSTTQLGLLTFRGWEFHLGRLSKSEAQRAVANTSPDGGTPLGDYMKKGADELLATRKKNRGIGTYTLLVFTDGQETVGFTMAEYTPEIVARGITLKTIGMDLNGEHELARYSQKYFPANNLASLEGALKQAIAEVPVGNDNIQENAFAMMAGIPDKMAPELINAITSAINSNDPIGEKKEKTVQSLSEDSEKEGLGPIFAILVFILFLCIFAVVLAGKVVDQ